MTVHFEGYLELRLPVKRGQVTEGINLPRMTMNYPEHWLKLARVIPIICLMQTSRENERRFWCQ